MDKKYQVFVSITHRGMEEARREIVQALLELDCLPCGLGLIPTGRQGYWALATKLIESCDYYAIVSGPPDGEVDLETLGTAEKEYRHAMQAGKPVLAFLHATPHAAPIGLPALPDEPQAEEGDGRLHGLRRLLGDRAVRDWSTPEELGSLVSRSFVQLIKLQPAGGLVPAEEAQGAATADEILRLRRRIDELEAKLKAARRFAPEAAENLAQGDDSFECRVNLETFGPGGEIEAWTLTCPVTWNEIFNAMAPYLLDEANELIMRRALNAWLNRSVAAEEEFREVMQNEVRVFELVDDDFQTIKVQLRALGLIEKTERSKSLKDNAAWWRLTPYGEDTMNRLRAIRREPVP